MVSGWVDSGWVEVWASGGCRIIKCGFIADLIKGRTDALGGGISARSFSPRLGDRLGRSGEAGGDWA